MNKVEQQLVDIIETLDMSKCGLQKSSVYCFAVMSNPIKTGFFSKERYRIFGTYDETSLEIEVSKWKTNIFDGSWEFFNSLDFNVNDEKAVERIRLKINSIVDSELLDTFKGVFCND